MFTVIIGYLFSNCNIYLENFIEEDTPRYDSKLISFLRSDLANFSHPDKHLVKRLKEDPMAVINEYDGIVEMDTDSFDFPQARIILGDEVVYVSFNALQDTNSLEIEGLVDLREIVIKGDLTVKSSLGYPILLSEVLHQLVYLYGSKMDWIKQQLGFGMTWIEISNVKEILIDRFYYSKSRKLPIVKVTVTLEDGNNDIYYATY